MLFPLAHLFANEAYGGMSWMPGIAVGLVVSIFGATICAQTCPAFEQAGAYEQMSDHARHCNHSDQSGKDELPMPSSEDSCNFLGKQAPPSFELLHSLSVVGLVPSARFTPSHSAPIKMRSERPPDYGLRATIDLLSLFQSMQV